MVFQRIYWVFLILGTLVGIVVISYMLYNAYKYRASAQETADDAADNDRPSLGEIPTGGGGGRKLFLSFALSAIIVVSLITWTYFTLLYVENPDPQGEEDPLTVKVVGYQFYWEFIYPNGHTVQGTLRIPEDRRVRLVVTSEDVFHNFGIPDLRAKADAIPGQTTSTWVMADKTGTYEANCYELCGQGHSYMSATVEVMQKGEYREWYAGTGDSGNESAAVTSPSLSAAAGNPSLSAAAGGV
jgi:cytochrome c oxidase subunit 2